MNHSEQPQRPLASTQAGPATNPATSRPPDWQLPPGVSRGLWDYTHARHIAVGYDRFHAQDSLFAFDQQLLEQEFSTPGRLIDLGCGTGRHLLAFAKQGFEVTGVDLSSEMLAIAQIKAASAGVTISTLQANIVELQDVPDSSYDYCFCLYSTLGMIDGSADRARALAHGVRVLKVGGRLALHVHNFWSIARQAQGRMWLGGHLTGWMLGRVRLGDKTANYRGIGGFTLHFFRAGELRNLLRQLGLQIRRWVPLTAAPVRALPMGWFASDWRAFGWVVIAEKTTRPNRPSGRTA